MFSRQFLSPLVFHASHELNLIVTGSYKRRAERVNDLDFLTYEDLGDVIKDWKYPISDYIAVGKKLLFFDTNFRGHKVPINIWKMDEHNEVFQLFSRDYPHYLEISARRIAKKKGLKLTQEGLFDRQTGKPIEVKDIKELFAILGIKYREPWQGSQANSSKGK